MPQIEEFTPLDVAELLAFFGTLKSERRWVFRGHCKQTWPLVPLVGRKAYPRTIRDELFFRKWKERAALLTSAPAADDWDWLALAQHHGLPTRLLDWTYNPLAACFFAVERPLRADAAVWCLLMSHIVHEELASPFNTRWAGVHVFRPRALTVRLTNQKGVFTIHQPPQRSLDDHVRGGSTWPPLKLMKVSINRSLRRELRMQLQLFGVDRASLFGDLDALSAQMAWEMQNIRWWVEPYVSVDLGIDYETLLGDPQPDLGEGPQLTLPETPPQ